MLRPKVFSFQQLVAILGLLLLPILAQGATRQVTLAWDASPDPAVIGYKLHYGTTSGAYGTTLDVGTNTSATISGLTAGTNFYFVVTAYSVAALDSAPTNELLYTTPPLVPPSVSIMSPVSGVQINGPISVNIDAQTSDPDGILSRVEFFQGAEKIGESAVPPFRVASENLEPGQYSLSAVAVAQDGTRSPSIPVAVQIVPLRVGAARFRADGALELTVAGATGSTNRVWYSDDLVSWHLLSTVTNTNGEVSVADPAARTVSKRFYKVSSP